MGRSLRPARGLRRMAAATRHGVGTRRRGSRRRLAGGLSPDHHAARAARRAGDEGPASRRRRLLLVLQQPGIRLDLPPAPSGRDRPARHRTWQPCCLARPVLADAGPGPPRAVVARRAPALALHGAREPAARLQGALRRAARRAGVPRHRRGHRLAQPPHAPPAARAGGLGGARVARGLHAHVRFAGRRPRPLPFAEAGRARQDRARRPGVSADTLGS